VAFEFYPLQALKTLFGYKPGQPPSYTDEPQSGAGVSTDSVVGEWFRKKLDLATDRIGICKEVEEMDQHDVISSAADLIAEDCTQIDLNTGKSIWVEAQDPSVEAFANTVLGRVEAEDIVFSIARDLIKYGDSFNFLLRSKSATGVPSKVVGLKWIDPKSIFRVHDEFDRLKGFSRVSQDDKESISAPWDYLHFRLLGKSRGTKYGSSYLAPARRLFRLLQMMEDALAIYRIRRAPDRLVFYLKGLQELSPTDRLHAFSRIRKQFRKRIEIDESTGQIRHEMNPLSVDDDLYVDEDAARVERMPGNVNVERVLDVDYIRKRLFGVLKIPPDYMGFSDARGGLLAASPLSHQDVQFGRTCKRIQKYVIAGFVRLIQIEMAWSNQDPTKESNDFIVKMVPVSYLDEMQWAQLLELKAKTLGILTDIGDALDIDKKAFIPYLIRLAGLPQEVIRAVEGIGRGEDYLSGAVDLTDSQKEAVSKALQVPGMQDKISDALDLLLIKDRALTYDNSTKSSSVGFHSLPGRCEG